MLLDWDSRPRLSNAAAKRLVTSFRVPQSTPLSLTRFSHYSNPKPLPFSSLVATVPSVM